MTEQTAAAESLEPEAPPTELEPASRRLDGRRDLMRNIANTARKTREDALENAGLTPPVEEPPVDETIQASVETAEEVAPTEEVPDKPPIVEEPPSLITFNLDGVEHQVTMEQAQGMLAAKAQADREIQDQAQRRAELEAIEAARPAPAPDLLPLAREAVAAILDSSEDEAAEKLATVLGNLRSEAPAIDTEAIIEQAARRAAPIVHGITEAEARQRAITRFRDERQDIFNDEFLYLGFDRAATKYSEEHPNAPPDEVLAKAAENVDNWKAQFAPASPPADTEFAEKEKRKAAATENASQISRRQQPPPEKKRETHSEYIAGLNKRRGRFVTQR